MKTGTPPMALEPVTIAPASQDQASQLALLIRQAYADIARRFNLSVHNAPTHPSLCTQDWIRSDRRAGVRYFLAARGRLQIGCVAVKPATPGCHYLMRLAVLPLFRRQGVGRRLIDHACDEARRAGASEVSAGIIAPQSELTAWYRRLGFQRETLCQFA